MVGVSLFLRLAGWAKTLPPGELERWQRAIGRTWRGFLAAMTRLTLYGELKRKKLASTSSAIRMSRSSNGWTGGGDTAVRLDWNGLLLSFFLCFTGHWKDGDHNCVCSREIRHQTKNFDTRNLPNSLGMRNVSLHHSFAVSWTQLLIKCDYSVCNGKTVTSVRVQKVLVAHQETETLSAVTVLPIGNSQKIVSVSFLSFHALEGARQGHCQKYVLILFIKPEKKRLWCLDVVIPFALIRTEVAVCQLYQISPPKRLEFSVMSTFKELPLVFTAE